MVALQFEYNGYSNDMTDDDLITDQIIENLFAENKVVYYNQTSPHQTFCEQKDAQAVQLMPTISEETKHHVEQESDILPHISLHQIADASTIAMSIINNETNTNLITISDSVDHMVILLRYGNAREKELAACALHRLATQKENRSIITRRGSIPPLLDIIQKGTTFQKDQALAAIATLIVNNDRIKLMIAHAEGISPILHVIRNGTEKQQGLAVRALYCLVKNEKIRDEVYRKGGISPLINLTVKYDTTPDLRRSAIATLKLLYMNKSIIGSS